MFSINDLISSVSHNGSRNSSHKNFFPSTSTTIFLNTLPDCFQNTSAAAQATTPKFRGSNFRRMIVVPYSDLQNHSNIIYNIPHQNIFKNGYIRPSFAHILKIIPMRVSIYQHSRKNRSMGLISAYNLCGNNYLHSQYFTFLLDFYSIRIYPTGRIGH